MAQPSSELVVWAREDVTLPGAGTQNKIKPINDLLDKGYDKGQKPAAQEFNYILNMSSAWTEWLVNEKIPEVEAEFNRKLNELEQRINDQLLIIKNDIAQLQADLNDLRDYVDQQFSAIRQDIANVRQEIANLRNYVDSQVADLQNKINAQQPFLVPIGGIIQWPSASVPQGWLECNGQSFNTTQNPKLYAALGKANVPDYRGLFLRGWAHGSGANDPDAGRALGSVQGDAIRNITGHFPADIGQAGWIGRYVGGVFRDDGALTSGDKGSIDGEVRKYSFDASREVPTAPENRPKNAAVMYIIKTDLGESSGGVAPSSIVMTPSNGITSRVGYTTTVTATVLPSSIASQYPVTFSSSNTAVATVDSQGRVALVGPGNAEIISSISSGLRGSIAVTSYSVLTSISIEGPTTITMPNSAQVSISKLPANASEPLTYSSSDQTVASINNLGIITPLGPGNTVITVRGSVSGVTAQRTITVAPAVVEEIVQDMRLGALATYTPAGNGMSWDFKAPQGCTLVGMNIQETGSNSADNIGALYYKPNQKKVNGVWVTISG